jgi:hypothetical protein
MVSLDQVLTLTRTCVQDSALNCSDVLLGRSPSPALIVWRCCLQRHELLQVGLLCAEPNTLDRSGLAIKTHQGACCSLMPLNLHNWARIPIVPTCCRLNRQSGLSRSLSFLACMQCAVHAGARD